MDQLIDLARRRLQLLNVGPTEISELERTRQPTDRLVFRSAFRRYRERGADEGWHGRETRRQADDACSIYRVCGSGRTFTRMRLDFCERANRVTVSLPALPNRSFEGRIVVISPTIDPVKRTAMVRIDIPNPDGQLRPGMFANVVAEIDAGEGLTIPFDAVLPTGLRMLAFVDRGSGSLEPRFIQVGREFVDLTDPNQDRYYQITGGLKEGERIVSSANFLIDAEAQVQGAVRDFGAEPSPVPGR